MSDAAHAGASVRIAHGAFTASCQRELPLESGWELARLPSFAVKTTADLSAHAASFRPAIVPGTAAMAARNEQERLDLDADDVVYRCRFTTPPHAGGRVLLCCDGLATLAEVFLNGRSLYRSDNMFHAHAHDVTAGLAPGEGENELCICFAALRPVLRARRPRGRWPTRLVSEKNLRFVRTTLLGYMPGFCPDVRAVGPWRAVRLVVQSQLALEHVKLDARVDAGTGVLDAQIELRVLGSASPGAAELLLDGGAARAALSSSRDGNRLTLRGQVRRKNAAIWWPHTHGAPTLHEVRAEVVLGAERVVIDLGRVGFRTLALDRGPDGDGFALLVNGERVFCRGACWTPLDVAALHAPESQLREALELARDGGMNMLRVGGTMVYESDAFHRLCDELGMLVWQDFMFANMDYPVGDAAFLASIEREARELLERIGHRPSLAMLCGGSEVAQQAAMMGLPRDTWSNAWFDERLPELCAERCPEVPYAPSSPSGGPLPFYSDAGPSHYYGVGAYLRPLEDARTANVRFASECLAFSNVPDDQSLLAWLGDAPAQAHHPRYKERVPRDGGAGWDFADVTDHYVELLYGVKTRNVRYADHERYLALCRAASGEVMAHAQGEWRRRASSCRGALIWFLRDLWQGAGWGVVDASGRPKAAFHHLKRMWQPRCVWFTDEGVNGLRVHLDNESSEPLRGELELVLYKPDGSVGERKSTAIELGARAQQSMSVEGVIGRFVDAGHAFRFGPPAFTLVVARLKADPVGGAGAARVLEAFHLPLGLGHAIETGVGLAAVARAAGAGRYVVDVRTERFAQTVTIDARGYDACDNFFHLAPHSSRQLELCARPGAGPLRARVSALNAPTWTTVKLESA